MKNLNNTVLLIIYRVALKLAYKTSDDDKMSIGLHCQINKKIQKKRGRYGRK